MNSDTQKQIVNLTVYITLNHVFNIYLNCYFGQHEKLHLSLDSGVGGTLLGNYYHSISISVYQEFQLVHLGLLIKNLMLEKSG
jgi:hypothetical protein